MEGRKWPPIYDQGEIKMAAQTAVTAFKLQIKGIFASPGVRNDFLGKLIPRDQLEAYVAAVQAGIWAKPELMEADPKSIILGKMLLRSGKVGYAYSGITKF